MKKVLVDLVGWKSFIPVAPKWKRIETDNVRIVFVCPNCKKEHNLNIFNYDYRPACYCDDSGVTCDLVGVEVEVKTAGKSEEKE